MKTRTIAWIAAIPCVAVLAAAAGGAPPGHGGHGASGNGKKLQERYLYVSTIAQSKTDPDFIAVIGADPRNSRGTLWSAG